VIERREELALRHVVHPQRKIGCKGRSTRISRMTGGALCLKYTPTDVGGEIDAARRVGRALDAIRSCLRNGLRRAGVTAERSA
jgi:hypothetical protein